MPSETTKDFRPTAMAARACQAAAKSCQRHQYFMLLDINLDGGVENQ